MRIDFDFKDLSKWENFYRFFKAINELRLVGAVRVTKTFKGYHIYSTYITDPEKELTLREYFGDDSIRIMYDEERAKKVPHLFDVLYNYKVAGSIRRIGRHTVFVKTEEYEEEEVYV